MQRDRERMILLVEDEPLAAATEQAKLERYGYRVMTADSGEKAIELVDRTPEVELILMDIDLGTGLDGTQAAQRILSRRDLPIIFVCSQTDPEILEKTERIASYGYILKNTVAAVLDASLTMAFKLFESRQTIARSEERFQNLFENMSDAFALHEVIFDETGRPVDFRYIEANERFTERLGMARKDLIGHTALELFPRTEPVWIAALGRVAATGSSEMLTSFSAELDRHYEARLYCPDEGYCAGLFSDVTDHILADVEARENERRWKMAQSVARIGGWEYDIETREFWSSDEARRICGLGQDGADLSPDALLERVVDRDRRLASRALANLVFEKAPCNIEIDINPHDSADVRTIRCDAEVIHHDDGMSTVVTGILQDVSEQKKLRDELTELKEFYADIINNLADLVTIVDSRGNFTFIGYEQGTLGYAATSLIGRNVMELVHPSDLPHVRREFDRLVAEGSPRVITFRYRLADGTYRWFESNGRAMKDDGGQSNRFVFNTRDITDRRAAEKRIRELADEKEVLLKEVHHRVKNTLQTMGSLLSLQAGAMQDTEAISALEEMRARFNAMEVLYEQLYRSDARESGSIQRYLTRLVDSITDLFPNSDAVAVETEISDLSLSAKHFSNLGMIVNELVTNSMKYAYDGRSNGKLRVTLDRVPGRIRLRVQDDGPGIPDSFDPDSSESFGMTIIRALADQMNGTVRFEQCHGTTALVEFEDAGLQRELTPPNVDKPPLLR